MKETEKRTRPAVSVLVPVYGVEKYIERCARSLFCQTMADVEFVFVNDCTPDKSIEVLREVMREYPDVNARIVDHATNKGLFCARRTAMDNATGEYWIHCDSDDWVEPDYCEKLYNAAVAENADIACCNVIMEWGGTVAKPRMTMNMRQLKIRFRRKISVW